VTCNTLQRLEMTVQQTVNEISHLARYFPPATRGHLPIVSNKLNCNAAAAAAAAAAAVAADAAAAAAAADDDDDASIYLTAHVARHTSHVSQIVPI
jgi:hypothetical protein